MSNNGQELERLRALGESQGYKAELVSDSAGPEDIYYYWVLVDPNGNIFDAGDEYGYGWGDNSELDAWLRMPEADAT